MKNKFTNSLQKAKDYAFLLLKFRPRSEAEICERLKKKKFDEKTIKETLSFLKEKNFIDDTQFTKAWIESRLKRPLGIRRIVLELKSKGIKNVVIDNQLEELKKNYSEEKIVNDIAQKKFAKLKNIEPDKAKRRILSYLLRRGFSPKVVFEVIDQL